MSHSPKREVLQIKKYPNRRYYDATRSCHVTLQEVYDLIAQGHDVLITDSRTGEDITSLVLLQVILEKDQPKLDLLPSAVLHAMIRSNRQVLRTFIEQSFGPFMKVMSTSRKQWDAYLRQTMSGKIMSPMDWADTMMDAFSPGRPSSDTAPPSDAAWPPDAAQPPGWEPSADEGGADEQPPQNEPEDIHDLREQVTVRTRQLEVLSARLAKEEPSPGSARRGKKSSDRR